MVEFANQILVVTKFCSFLNTLRVGNNKWKKKLTWNDCESMPVEKVAMTIAHIAIKKLWKDNIPCEERNIFYQINQIPSSECITSYYA